MTDIAFGQTSGALIGRCPTLAAKLIHLSPVAVHTPPHGESFGRTGLLHLLHPTMTIPAAKSIRSGIHLLKERGMSAVTETDEIGKIGDPDPVEGVAQLETAAEILDVRTVRGDELVTAEAQSAVGKGGVIAAVGGGVTEQTIQFQFGAMEAMAEGDGLR